MKTQLLVAVATVAVIAGCGRGRANDPIGAAREAIEDVNLQGKDFSDTCRAEVAEWFQTLFSSGTTVKSSMRSYNFGGNTVTLTTDYYQTADCSAEPAYTFSESGTFDVHSDKEINGARPIDLKFDKLTVKIHSDEGAKAANALTNKVCGIGDWSAGQEREVTGQAGNMGCYNASLPRNDFNIYRLEGGDQNKLIWGSILPVVDANKRPTQLNTSVIYQAQ